MANEYRERIYSAYTPSFAGIKQLADSYFVFESIPDIIAIIPHQDQWIKIGIIGRSQILQIEYIYRVREITISGNIHGKYIMNGRSGRNCI